jgi:maltose alpha-D-glucosyltransferase/alpha-amylase
MDAIRSLWSRLYGREASTERLYAYLEERRLSFTGGTPFPVTGLVYCTYADAFGDLDGVRAQLPRLKALGVTVLWILPLLQSPGRDQGFDISDYTKVNPRFGGDAALDRLLAETKPLGISLLFDIAVNHASDQHSWFQAARDPKSRYRDYFIWSETGKEYAETSLIFPDMVTSNWTWRPEAGAWNFHRFYPFQPDLNYRNPQVAFEMIRVLVDWKSRGIEGFRMDAAPFLWKEDGTPCLDLPEVHVILKLFQACLDYVAPGSLLLAEANTPTHELRDYFGDGDECKGAYHFELMPRFYKALLDRDPRPLAETPFPALPGGSAWFTFLRVHDEVTLDLVSPGDRARLVAAYTKIPEAAFRNGQAFSGRLFELLDRDPQKVLAAWSLLFSLPGMPILYYGDEIGMLNNREYFEATAAQTGYRDSRFLHRGPWDKTREASSARPDTPEGRLRAGLEAMLTLRREHASLAAAVPEVTVEGAKLTSVRRAAGQTLTMVTDLSNYSHAWIVK